MTNFQDILNTKIEDVERPPLPPQGNYVFKVTKLPEQDEIADGKYQVVDFTCQAIVALGDLDVSEYGKVTDITIRHRFMFSTDPDDKTKRDRSLFNLKRFLVEHLCIDGAEKMAIGEALSKAVNHQFVGQLGWRPDQNDPEVFYPEIKRTAPTEE